MSKIIRKMKVGKKENSQDNEQKSNGITISSKVSKPARKKNLTNDIMYKFLTGFFNKELSEEFGKFLQERAKVIPISSANKKDVVYKKEGSEPISFKEMTSYANPAFSMGGMFSPEEYNPETIDVSTFTLMRRDHQLAAGLALIKLPIIALPWRIECDDIKIAKTTEWALKRVWKDLVRSSLLAVDYGFATHEKVWERDNVKISDIDKEGKETIYYDGDLVYFKKIKPNHPESISMKFDDKQNLEEVIQQSIIGNDKINLPIRKVFLFTNDKEFGNPWGVSRLKNAYKVWYWKELLYQFMMQYYERRGTPPAIATVPPGNSIDSSGVETNNMELGLRLASSLISSSVGVIPYVQNRDGNENMWKLELLNDDARGPMFVDAMVHLDARCLRAIYVPETILTQDSGGGYGGISVLADLFLMSEKGLIADLEEAVSQQLIKPFVEANFPQNKRRPAHVKLDSLDWNRKIALKEIFVEMLRNIDTMVQMGVAPNIVPDIERMAAILEIPVQTWKDATGLEGVPIPEVPTVNEDGTKAKKKVAGRKNTRGQSTSQETARRGRQPGDRRADRDRVTDTSKKK